MNKCSHIISLRERERSTYVQAALHGRPHCCIDVWLFFHSPGLLYFVPCVLLIYGLYTQLISSTCVRMLFSTFDICKTGKAFHSSLLLQARRRNEPNNLLGMELWYFTHFGSSTKHILKLFENTQNSSECNHQQKLRPA